ncbi:uncharacterized protein LOC110051124 isoform X1 [Orbicella faveolata]|uniref:uncharacterized protein LOC110051124 isoform X1 n=2 Tax=Orbicella faveolata TaxID=48498 RepID=UPI0009E5DF0F|nr:uncharacterized protein LOC110051124 isoform X1 [Orbicella faveolata]
MYRLSSPRFAFTRVFHENKPPSSLLCTATKPEEHSLEENTSQISSDTKDALGKQDLQKRVLRWDEKLPIPDPPPLKSLLDFLVRRRTLSCSSGWTRTFNKLLVRSTCRILGLQRAHKRMREQHTRDPVHNCWYAPANHGDTFGIRHDEIYFHEDIIPSQPVTSYAVLIRGSSRNAGTSVEGGIGEFKSSRDVSSTSQPDAMVDRAVSLIDGLMKARDFYMSSEFNQDVIKETPLSMQWYNYIFSCSMQFLPGSIERYKAPAGHSRHIIVMVRGNMYKVDLTCTNEDGQEIGTANNDLRKQMKEILLTDACRESSTPIAVLTTMTPPNRCQEEQLLKCLSERNVTNLSLVRDALFVVALDPDDSPRTVNEAMFALHSGNFINRWYDKSVQLVVFGNGVAGFVNNYLAAMTGTVGTNFVRIAVGNEGLCEEHAINDDVDVTISPEPFAIRWDDTADGYFKQKIKSVIKTNRTSGPFKPVSQDVFKICPGYSFEELCKEHRVTPGGAFQAGMQLALSKIAGRCMSVNEVVSIRHLRFGGMTLMDSSMADMKKFVEEARRSSLSMSEQERLALKSLLKEAIQSYKDEVLRYKNGEINLWHLDSLYRNLGLTNRLPFRKAPRLGLLKNVKEIVLGYIRAPQLNILPPQVAENVTSNPCWYPEIEAIGRPGVKCILPPTSMALHYMFGRNAISITVNANPDHPCYKNEETFVKELESSLRLVKDLLNTK